MAMADAIADGPNTCIVLVENEVRVLSITADIMAVTIKLDTNCAHVDHQTFDASLFV